MKEAREEFYKLCTMEGLLENTSCWCRMLYNYGATLCMILILGTVSAMNVIIYINYDISIFDGNSLAYWLGSINVLLIFVFGFIFLVGVLSIVQHTVIKNLRIKYKSALEEFFETKKIKYFSIEWVKSVFDLNNEYHLVINYLKEKGKEDVYEQYFKKIGREYIEEAVKYNQSKIEESKVKVTMLSNRVFYAFVGGVIINKVVNVLYDYFMRMNIGVELVILYLIILGVIIVWIGIVVIKGYNYMGKKLSKDEYNQINKTEIFNEYLMEKKIELLKKTTKQ